jgi:hypothetical protein
MPVFLFACLLEQLSFQWMDFYEILCWGFFQNTAEQILF